MPVDQFVESRRHFSANIRKMWGSLDENQVAAIAVTCDRLADRIQETYGFTKVEAEKLVLAEWQSVFELLRRLK
ncbi:MAG: general stress protein CsbD [Betaproteobacteria bacterium]